MTWNYRVIHQSDNGIGSYEIHEVYYVETGWAHSYTESSCQPFGETPEELRLDLLRMLEALERPVLTPKDFRLAPQECEDKTPEAFVARYRKKPVEIEAVRFDGRNGPLIELWSGGKVGPSPGNSSCLQIMTLEGAVVASVGDWIIRGVAGEYYPCKPGIFDSTYEKVESTGPECVT